MSDRIPIALTVEEWGAMRVEFVGLPDLVFHDDGDGMELVACGDDGSALEKWKFNVAPDIDLPALIALANAALPDDDPRKITREWVREICYAAEAAAWGDGAQNESDRQAAAALNAIAAALESYLPPEDTR